MSQSRLRWIGWSLLWIASLSSCRRPGGTGEASTDAVRVDGFSLGGDYLEAARQALAPYATERFSGERGSQALLANLINLELLATKARDAGFLDDPRVDWSVVDAQAQTQARAIKERRVPRASLSQNRAGLSAFIQENPAALGRGEERRAWVALAEDWRAARILWTELSSGARQPKDVPGAQLTAWMKRDDKRFPVFHRLLFDAALAPGEWLAGPVPLQDKVAVVRLEGRRWTPAPSLEDPAGRAKVVDAAIEAPQREALETYLQGLRVRWPLNNPS